MLDRMPDGMPEDLPDNMPEDMPDRMPDGMPEDMPEHMPEDMPEDMPEHLPEDMPEHLPEDMPEDMPEHLPEDMPGRMPEDMPDRMPEDLPVTKCINVMVGITRSKVIFFSSAELFSKTGRCLWRPGDLDASPLQRLMWSCWILLAATPSIADLCGWKAQVPSGKLT